MAIQVSGTFGSRQEEAQRLGRILRPKKHGLLAHFYTLVTRDSRDQEFAVGRTVWIITHRLSTLALADRILVMDGGRVADLGTHVELMSRCALYERLYSLQLQRTA